MSCAWWWIAPVLAAFATLRGSYSNAWNTTSLISLTPACAKIPCLRLHNFDTETCKNLTFLSIELPRWKLDFSVNSRSKVGGRGITELCAGFLSTKISHNVKSDFNKTAGILLPWLNHYSLSTQRKTITWKNLPAIRTPATLDCNGEGSHKES